MKRFFCCLLSTLLLGLCACSSAGTGTQSMPAPGTTAAPAAALQVGYGRVDITPNFPVNLEGYGTTRMHNNVLDPLYLTCVAITDSEGSTLLMFSVDAMAAFEDVTRSLISKVSNKFDIPVENITVSATHTHSAPSVAGSMSAVLSNAVNKAAKQALDDRSPARMFYGTAQTEGLNFVRHYIMNDGSYAGDNFGSWSSGIMTHVSQADPEMRVLKFQRESGKDVVLANWQSHPHMTGGNAKLDMSADIVGAFRMSIEKEADCHFAYFQGAAGNINPTSYITAKNTANPDKNYLTHGKLLSKHCRQALEDMTELQAGPIRIASLDFEAQCDHSDEDQLDDAILVRDFYKGGKTIQEATDYAKSLGFHSYYQTTYVIARSQRGKSETVPLRACTVGDFGFVAAPFEMFDTTGIHIREQSPTKATFILGYTNGYMNYIASESAYEHGCYEVDTRRYVVGTAEQIADSFIALLKEAR